MKTLTFAAIAGLTFLANLSILNVGTASAANRLWTDAAGNKLRAEFLTMHLGNVLLRESPAKQPVPVFFYTLSEADQTYLRDTLKAQKREGLIPRIGESRIWTRTSGETFEGQFLSQKDGMVLLWVAGTKLTYQVSNLLPADQSYINQTMSDWGLASLPSNNFNDGSHNDGSSFPLPGSSDNQPGTGNGLVVDVGPPSDKVNVSDPSRNPTKVGLAGGDNTTILEHGDGELAMVVPEHPVDGNFDPQPSGNSETVATIGEPKTTFGTGTGFGSGRQAYAPPSSRGNSPTVLQNPGANAAPAPAASSTQFAPVSDGGGPIKTIAILLGVLAIGAAGFRWYQNRAYTN